MLKIFWMWSSAIFASGNRVFHVKHFWKFHTLRTFESPQSSFPAGYPSAYPPIYPQRQKTVLSLYNQV